MPRFQKTPVQIDALQFTGGAANAQAIALAAAKVGAKVRWVPEHSAYSITGGTVVESKIPEYLEFEKADDIGAAVPKGSWLFVDADNEIRVMSNAAFVANYQPV